MNPYILLKTQTKTRARACAYLHAFDATHPPPAVVGRVHRGPLLLGHPIVFIRFLRARQGSMRRLVAELLDVGKSLTGSGGGGGGGSLIT